MSHYNPSRLLCQLRLLAFGVCALLGLTGTLPPAHASICSGSITAAPGVASPLPGSSYVSPDVFRWGVYGSWDPTFYFPLMPDIYAIRSNVYCILTYHFVSLTNPANNTDHVVVSDTLCSQNSWFPFGSSGSVSGLGTYGGYVYDLQLNQSWQNIATSYDIKYELRGSVLDTTSNTQVSYVIKDSDVTHTMTF